MNTNQMSWFLLALISVAQGNPSTGQLRVRSTGATGTLPPFSIGIPIVGGQLDYELAVMVEKNEATTDGSWPITSAGTLVDVTSIGAGDKQNVAAGIECRWLPPVDGLEETSEITAAGLTGATQSAKYGSLQQVRMLEDIGDREAAQQLARGLVTPYPAAVLSWARTVPADGATSPDLGSRAAMGSEDSLIMSHTWELRLVVSRLDAAEGRSREGAALRDRLFGIITGRHAWRGKRVSGPKGLQVLDAHLESVTAATFIYLLAFTATTTASRDKSIEKVTWAEWRKTRIMHILPPQGASTPLPLLDVTAKMKPT